MMVGNAGQPGFGDRLAQSQAQGDMHGYGQDIFCDQDVDIEFIDERMQPGL